MRGFETKAFDAEAAFSLDRVFAQPGTVGSRVVPATANSATVIGITVPITAVPLTTPYTTVDVQAYGFAKVRAGAVIAAGSRLTCDASGRAIVATTGQNVYAVALDSAAALNDIIEVAITLGGKF